MIGDRFGKPSMAHLPALAQSGPPTLGCHVQRRAYAAFPEAYRCHLIVHLALENLWGSVRVYDAS
jgi:hypothetical protein